jgi:hypothetical protein
VTTVSLSSEAGGAAVRGQQSRRKSDSDTVQPSVAQQSHERGGKNQEKKRAYHWAPWVGAAARRPD